MTDKLKRYIAQISFYMPQFGPVQVFAKDEEHARELIPKIGSHLRDLTIHHIAPSEEFEQAILDDMPPMDGDEGGSAPTNTMVN